MKQFFDIENNKIRCNLCVHHCLLKEHQVGICGVNQNIYGELKNLVYGKPVSINIDPIEKKPLYHFLPASYSLSIGTVGCNMQCPFCQNWHISQQHNIENSRFISPEQIIEIATQNNCRSISYTYNEPTIFYPYARDIALLAKAVNIKNVFVTNGLMSDEVISDLKYSADACNIDLKSPHAEFYKKKLKAPFKIFDNIIKIKETGVWVEITTLLIPGENDSKQDIMKIIDFIKNHLGTDVPWHISAFHPDYKMLYKNKTPLNSLFEAYEMAIGHGLKYVYLGNIAFDNDTNCPDCGSKLIEREKYNTIKIKDFKGACPDCKTVIPGIWA
jgi:pyruvate formate lyase activating enzyme